MVEDTPDSWAALADQFADGADIGGGAGHQSFPLAVAGYEVTLLDPSQAMLDKADGADAEEATGGRRFAAVLCHGVLGYLPDPAALLDQICRRADDGGVVSIMAGNANAMAVRPALERRWGDALAAFDAREEVGVLGVPTRADTVEESAAQPRLPPGRTEGEQLT